MRRVLLIEPGYKNKYPPLGLMKLATYHRHKGDFVRFWKGDVKGLILDLLVEDAFGAFRELDPAIKWGSLRQLFSDFIRRRRNKTWQKIESKVGFYSPTVRLWLDRISQYYRAKQLPDRLLWDRACVTTLFTFDYRLTVETIRDVAQLVSNQSEVFIGGIAASVIPDEFEEATGIRPVTGVLSSQGILDADDETVIDNLPPDYSILHEVDYQYPEGEAYLAYTTRGCIRNCPFCAVPVLEPHMVHFISASSTIAESSRSFGERRNLLLLDNNVLASDRLPEIVEDVKRAGFGREARHQRPNQLEIAKRGLESGYNDYGYRRHFWRQVSWLLPRLGDAERRVVEERIDELQLDIEIVPTKDECLALAPVVAEPFEKRRYKRTVARHIDFNQGIDARLCNERTLSLLSQLALKPLRIAFDTWHYRTVYENAVRLASSYEFTQLSNYLLYNYEERPEELWQRLELNIRLSEELNLDIYSFPMKYNPIWDESGYHLNRNFIGRFWNRKYLRAVQTILNSTKGKVSRKRDFFEKAFGRNIEEFKMLLYMPENYLLLRFRSEELGLTASWHHLLQAMNGTESDRVLNIIHANRFSDKILQTVETKPARLLLAHYTVKFDEIKNGSAVERVEL